MRISEILGAVLRKCSGRAVKFSSAPLVNAGIGAHCQHKEVVRHFVLAVVGYYFRMCYICSYCGTFV